MVRTFPVKCYLSILPSFYPLSDRDRCLHVLLFGCALNLHAVHATFGSTVAGSSDQHSAILQS